MKNWQKCDIGTHWSIANLCRELLLSLRLLLPQFLIPASPCADIVRSIFLTLSDDFRAPVGFLAVELQKPLEPVLRQHIIPFSFSRKVWLISAYTNGLTVELNSTSI